MRRLRVSAIAALSALAVGCAACGSSSNKGSGSTGAPGNAATTVPSLHGTINVLAAASLTNAFTQLGKEFEAAYPGTSVKFSFGSSSTLATQIENGAPADVYASADQTNMNKIVKAGDSAGTPVNIAKNKIEIAVERGNPKHIDALSDLTGAGIVVVLCDPSVPCGKFGDQVLANAGVKVTPKSREVDVKATLSKVELGEADAALVYASDVASSGKIEGVTIPDAANVVTTLPMVVVKDAPNPTVARAWTDYVVAHRSEVVRQFGFLPR